MCHNLHSLKCPIQSLPRVGDSILQVSYFSDTLPGLGQLFSTVDTGLQSYKPDHRPRSTLVPFVRSQARAIVITSPTQPNWVCCPHLGSKKSEFLLDLSSTSMFIWVPPNHFFLSDIRQSITIWLANVDGQKLCGLESSRSIHRKHKLCPLPSGWSRGYPKMEPRNK